MTTVSYLPEVECIVDVPDGILNTSVVSVADKDDNKQFLRVGKGQVKNSAGKNYLSVWVVQLDDRQQRVLIELPQEADSGVKRIWVPLSRFRPVTD